MRGSAFSQLRQRAADSSRMRQQAELEVSGEEDVAARSLSSVAVPLCAVPPRGSVQSLAHTSLPCSVEVCEPLTLCPLHRDLLSVFTGGFELFETPFYYFFVLLNLKKTTTTTTKGPCVFKMNK